MKTLATRITDRLVTAHSFSGSADKITKALTDKILKHDVTRQFITNIIGYGVESQVDYRTQELGEKPSSIKLELSDAQLKEIVNDIFNSDSMDDISERTIESVGDLLAEAFPPSDNE